MFLDFWRRDSFLPPPPEDAQQYSGWICFLVVATLLGAAVSVMLKKKNGKA